MTPLGTLVAFALAVLGPAASGAAQTFTARPIGALDPASFTAPTAVNESGQVAGWVSPDTQAFFWADGTLTRLGRLPGAVRSFATGLNESGVVVGYNENDDHSKRAFRWEGGVMTDPTSPVGSRLGGMRG